MFIGLIRYSLVMRSNWQGIQSTLKVWGGIKVMDRKGFVSRVKARPVLCFYPSEKRWELACCFEDRFIAKIAGFRWFPESKVWGTDDPKCAVRLIKYATSACRAQLVEMFGSLN